MNAVVKIRETEDKELIEVLKNSLYPGAQDASVNMVIGYCKATGLDPMLKPVHIVPIYDNKTKSMRDTIMPGIGLYRTIAARTGQYAGVSEPEFGPDVEHVFEEETYYDAYSKTNKVVPAMKLTFPAYCKITIRKIMENGTIAEFSATERWLENYATASKNVKHPNAMWARRPYAQINKCVESQALRKAFPEVGAQPTADEIQEIEINPEFSITPFAEPEKHSQPAAQHGFKAKPTVIEGQKPTKEIPQKWFDDNKAAWINRAQVEAGAWLKDNLIQLMRDKGGHFTETQIKEVDTWFIPAEVDNWREVE